MEKKTIILSGGGTGGSVVPLIAIAKEIRNQSPKTRFLFVGTKKGVPEKELIKEHHLPYQGVFSGKLRRYFSWQNLIDPFLIFLGFIQSIFIILKYRPRAIVSAGGFVAVPLSLAAWLFKVPVFIHQQDLIPGLANKIITPFAKKITVSFKKSLKDFPSSKVVFTGNPFRKSILKGDIQRAKKRFNLSSKLPVLLVVGGGTGAKNINNLIYKLGPRLVKFCQVIHITGKNKGKELKKDELMINRYHQVDFLTWEMPDVYQIADLVISRAGLGALTELSVLGKPSIIIPISNSHQEINAQYFANQEAVILIKEEEIKEKEILDRIKKLINDQEKLKKMSQKIKKIANPKAGEKIAKIILS